MIFSIYGNRYYLSRGNVWYSSQYYNGPWVTTSFGNVPYGLRRLPAERIHYSGTGIIAIMTGTNFDISVRLGMKRGGKATVGVEKHTTEVGKGMAGKFDGSDDKRGMNFTGSCTCSDEKKDFKQCLTNRA